MEFKTHEGLFPSANETDQIAYRMMLPEGNPRGILLILHGMRSYSGRYLDFSRYLCEKGFVVYLYDLAGHGKSVGEGGKFGSFAERDGDVVLVKDLDTMVGIIRKRYRHLPLFAFGHSLGSFVVRAYIATHKDSFDGAIFCGTCQRMSFSFFQKRKLRRLCEKAGREPSEAVDALMVGAFEKAYREPGGWLTTRPELLKSFKNDPLSGHPMCADAYYDIFRLMQYISSDEWCREVPQSLPLLFVSGMRDPLGGNGKGIAELVDTLDDLGVCDMTVRLYEGEKHELLDSLSDGIFKEDIVNWLNEKALAAIELQQTSPFGGFRCE